MHTQFSSSEPTNLVPYLTFDEETYHSLQKLPVSELIAQLSVALMKDKGDKEHRYLLANRNIFQCYLHVLNEKLENREEFDEKQLKTVYKIIKKLGGRDFLQKNFTIHEEAKLESNSLLLACQSNFFATVFAPNFSSIKKLEHTDDDSQEALQFIHHYLNTGEVMKINKKKREDEEDLLIEIFRKAGEWNLYRLIKMLNKSFTLSPENAVRFLSTISETGYLHLLEKYFKKLSK